MLVPMYSSISFTGVNVYVPETSRKYVKRNDEQRSRLREEAAVLVVEPVLQLVLQVLGT